MEVQKKEILMQTCDPPATAKFDYNKILNPIDLKTKKTILLTGAGFTKDYGGYLSGEMWQHIFNSPEVRLPKNKIMRHLLTNYLDYEEAYNQILEKEEIKIDDENVKITEDIKDNFKKVLKSAYIKMDKEIAQKPFKKTLLRFLDLFKGDTLKKEKGFIFTTNQDLFIERFYIEWRSILNHAGTSQAPSGQTNYIEENNLLKINNAKIQKEEIQDWLRANYFYIKLHGSFNWESDEGSMMIIGKKKAEDLEKFELLKFYKSLFKKVITQGGVKLVTVGYSFSDEHINSIILEAADSGLELYVITPDSIRDYLGGEANHISDKGQKVFMKCLTNYYRSNFIEIFSEHGRSNDICEEIIKSLSTNNKTL